MRQNCVKTFWGGTPLDDTDECSKLLTVSGFREEKGTQTQTFWSGYLLVGGGGLPCEGVEAKKFGMSFETQGN